MGSGAESLALCSLLGASGAVARVRLLTDSSSAKAMTGRRGLGRVKRLRARMLAVQLCVVEIVSTAGKVFTEETLPGDFTKPVSGACMLALGRMVGLRGGPLRANALGRTCSHLREGPTCSVARACQWCGDGAHTL